MIEFNKRWDYNGLTQEGLRRGFWRYDFSWPMIRLADGFTGNSDEYKQLWDVYESSYAEGVNLRRKVEA